MAEKFEPINKRPLAEEVEDIVKATLGKDVFFRDPKENGDAFKKTEEVRKEKSQKDYRPFVKVEIDRLGNELGLAKKNLREAKSQEETNYYKEKVEFLTKHFEEAKAKRDEIKERELAKGGEEEEKRETLDRAA